MFCPKCGSIMIPKKNPDRKKAKKAKKGEEEESPKKILACSSCGYSDADSSALVIKEKSSNPQEMVSIIEEDVTAMPLIDAECEKCGHSKAYFWTLQTRAADEPETKFMRCEKCKHTWRDYD